MDNPDSANPANAVRTGKPSSTKTRLLLVVLAVLALGGIAYSVTSWRQNQDLRSDMAALQAQVDNLKKQVESPRPAPADDTEEPASNQIQGEVGKSVETDSGTLTVNLYKQSSRKDTVPSFTSTEPILRVNITLENTTDSAQTYTAGQFTFVDSAKTQNSDMNATFKPMGYTGMLDTVTLESDGSVTTNMYFDEYDAKEGTFKWINTAGQEVRVTLPAL